MAIQVVEYHLGRFTPAQLDHHAHAVLVGLVAQLGDALDTLVLDQLGDLFQQPGLVDLIRQLGDHDGLLAARIDILEVRTCPDMDPPAARFIGLADTASAVDHTGGREIRARQMGHQLVDGDVFVVDDGQTGADDLADVVWRDIGGHADRDPRAAVDQQVGQARGQHRRLGFRLVVVRNEIDRVLADIRQQLVGELVHAHFGITHGRRCVAIDRAEVALTVDQDIPHGEVLGHAHDRVVNGRIPVRVILTDHVADYAGRFLVGLVPVVGQLGHGIKHTPMHRFQTITHIGKRTAHDHAHGVVEIRLAHLVFEVDRENLFCDVGHRSDRLGSGAWPPRAHP